MLFWVSKSAGISVQRVVLTRRVYPLTDSYNVVKFTYHHCIYRSSVQDGQLKEALVKIWSSTSPRTPQQLGGSSQMLLPSLSPLDPPPAHLGHCLGPAVPQPLVAQHACHAVPSVPAAAPAKDLVT